MLTNKKHVFWQAFFLTALFFLLGIVFGIYLEQSRADSLNTEFFESEASLYDSFALGNVIKDSSQSCDVLKDYSVNFADDVYEKARDLEQFDESNKLTDSVKAIHKKYDSLRTLLWMNIISLKESCDGVNTVVYLYNYETSDIEMKSQQSVWSKILSDLKQEEGNDIILIPVAADQGVTSLDFLMNKYDVQSLPAVVINEEDVFYEHRTAEELKVFLD